MSLLDVWIGLWFSFWNLLMWPFTPSPFPSRGKRILVTGAASGIGKATAFELLNRGCYVYAADLNKDALEKIYKGENAVTILKMDVTSRNDIENAFNVVKKDGLGLYGIVNSAGIPFAGQTEKGKNVVLTAPDLDIDKNVIPVFAVNTFGPMRIISTFFPLILEAKGCIINISSLAGRVAVPTASPYCGSKFAINGYHSSSKRSSLLWSACLHRRTGFRRHCPDQLYQR